jgi:single-strand DNA-binding protein
LNKIVLLGRLTRNPTIKYPKNGIIIGNFTLAVTRHVTNSGKEEADYLSCTTFDKQAVFIYQYLKQGSKIIVFGRIQNNNYVGKDGQMNYGIQVIVDEIEFAENKN